MRQGIVPPNESRLGSSASGGLVNNVTHKDRLHATVADFDDELWIGLPADPPTQFVRRRVVRSSVQYSSSIGPIANGETPLRAKTGTEKPHPVTEALGIEEDQHLRVVPRLKMRSNVKWMLIGTDRVG